MPTWNREDIPIVKQEKQIDLDNETNEENKLEEQNTNSEITSDKENKIEEQDANSEIVPDEGNKSEEQSTGSETISNDENKKDQTQTTAETIEEKDSKEFVEVDVFTDAYKVELYLNGKLVGTQTATEQISNGGGYKYYTFGKMERLVVNMS